MGIILIITFWALVIHFLGPIGVLLAIGAFLLYLISEVTKIQHQKQLKAWNERARKVRLNK